MVPETSSGKGRCEKRMRIRPAPLILVYSFHDRSRNVCDVRSGSVDGVLTHGVGVPVEVEVKPTRLHGGGEVGDVQFVDGVVSGHDDPVVFRRGGQGCLEPRQLVRARLRQDVCVELARSLEGIRPAADRARGVLCTARVVPSFGRTAVGRHAPVEEMGRRTEGRRRSQQRMQLLQHQHSPHWQLMTRQCGNSSLIIERASRTTLTISHE